MTPCRSRYDGFVAVRLYLILFIAYLSMGVPLPVIPLYVSDTLGLGDVAAGTIMSLQCLATLASSGYAGHVADRMGPKQALRRGLMACACSGVAYLVSNLTVSLPWVSIAVMVLGRILLGFGEGHVAISILTWCVALVPAQQTGVAINGIGVGFFGAMSVGPVIGLWLYDKLQWMGIAWITACVPVLAMLLSTGIADVIPKTEPRIPLRVVASKVLGPGLALAGQTIGVAMVSIFISLRFYAEGWPGAGVALGVFSACNVGMRLVCRKLPDQLGGVLVASVALLVEAFGLIFLALANSAHAAILSVVLIGVGCALVYPALALVVVARVPAHQRGVALGGYSMMMDLANGLTGPLAGLLAANAGYGVMYAVGALVALVAAVISIRLDGS
jgi:MFS family permease